MTLSYVQGGDSDTQEASIQRIQYQADESDPLDKAIGDKIKELGGSIVPIARLGSGYYYFGTRKAQAKLINSNPYVYVGGGYMTLDEYVRLYFIQEYDKMHAKHAKGLQRREGRSMSTAVKTFRAGHQ